jgi:hypothetical protein
LLVCIDLARFFKNLEVHPLLLRKTGKCSYILGKTGAPVAETGAKELSSDARSSRVMALNGLRMMPLSPSPSLKLSSRVMALNGLRMMPLFP